LSNLVRVYHPVHLWEEVTQSNMWGEVEDRKEMLKKAVEFTGDHKLYGSYMFRVIEEWPYSCENALTDRMLNRKAWIGHAACAMAIGCPEDITRKAWGFLTHEQRAMANRQAATAIGKWEENYRKSKGLCPNVARPMLFDGDTRGSAGTSGENRTRAKLEENSHVPA
jgi:hypothetical protein